MGVNMDVWVLGFQQLRAHFLVYRKDCSMLGPCHGVLFKIAYSHSKLTAAPSSCSYISPYIHSIADLAILLLFLSVGIAQTNNQMEKEWNLT